MYAMLNEEQLALRDAVDSLAQSVGVANPVDLDSRDHAKTWSAMQQMGLLELRHRDEGQPAASGVEIMVCAQSLAAGLVPAPFLPAAVLAVELLELAGAPSDWVASATADGPAYGLLMSPDLASLATVASQDSLVWGGPGTRYVLALDGSGDDVRLVRLSVTEPWGENVSVDLTRGLYALPGHDVEVVGDSLSPEDLDTWRALALAAICADTVGTMRRALDGVVAYSKERIAYGVPIGSFQAIQHMAAETLVTIEAAYGATCYAAWCVDETDSTTALLAARTAKAYCASVSRTAAENVMQMYGGVGQTWEHIAHFYTRRVLVNTLLFGDEDTQLAAIADARLGGN